MKPTHRLVLAFGAAGLLLAWNPTDAEPRFAPQVGTSVAKTFASVMTFELDDLSVMVDGENVMGMIGVPTMSMTLDRTITVEDEYRSMGEGRPSKVVRTFETLLTKADADVEMAGESQTETSEGSSDLEGKEVVFTWDEAAGEHTVEWAPDNSGDAALLDGLEEDMDLRVFLPGRAVKTGDSWELPLSIVQRLWAPGGDLGWSSDDSDEQMEATLKAFTGQFLGDSLEQMVTGTRTATYQGMRELEGVNVAVIAITIDLEIALDMADMIMELVGSIAEMPAEIDFELTRATFTGSTAYEGELLWNMTGGFVHSMELEGTLEGSMDVELSVDAMGETTDVSASAVFSGTERSTVTAQGR